MQCVLRGFSACKKGWAKGMDALAAVTVPLTVGCRGEWKDEPVQHPPLRCLTLCRDVASA